MEFGTVRITVLSSYLKQQKDGAKSKLVQGRITKITYKGDKGYAKYLDYTTEGMLSNALFFPVSVIDIDALVERDIELVLPESEKN